MRLTLLYLCTCFVAAAIALNTGPDMPRQHTTTEGYGQRPSSGRPSVRLDGALERERRPDLERPEEGDPVRERPQEYDGLDSGLSGRLKELVCHPSRAPAGGQAMRRRMLVGSYSNDRLVAQQARDNVPMQQRVLPETSISILLNIASVLPPAFAIFRQFEVVGSSGNTTRIAFLEVFDVRRNDNRVLFSRTWAFKNPAHYIDGWKNLSIFAELEPTDGESEELTLMNMCETNWSLSAGDGSLSSSGFSSGCVMLLDETVLYQPISVEFTPTSLTLEGQVVSKKNGTVLAHIMNEMDKISQDPLGPILVNFLAMLSGRFNNKRQISQEAEDNVEMDQRTPAVTMLSWPVHITVLPPHIKAQYLKMVVQQGSNQFVIPVIVTFEETGDSLIHEVVYRLNPREYADVDPDSFSDGHFDLPVKSDIFTASSDCHKYWRKMADGEGFTKESSSADCYIPVTDELFIQPGEGVLTPSSYTMQGTIYSEVGGPALVSRRYEMERVATDPTQPEMTFAGIKSALINGQSGHYRLPLSHCETNRADIDPDIFGGAIRNFELLNYYGSFLRIAKDQTTFKPDGSGVLRMTEMKLYENDRLYVDISELPFGKNGSANPITTKSFHCSLLADGPRGPIPAFIFRKPKNINVLPSATTVIKALRRAQTVKLIVNYAGCQKTNESSPNFIQQTGNTIEDFDLTTEGSGAELTFTGTKTRPSACSEGTMITGWCTSVHMSTNTVSMYYWAKSSSTPSVTCYDESYTCPIVADGESGGATFYLV